MWIIPVIIRIQEQQFHSAEQNFNTSDAAVMNTDIATIWEGI
jgi:hypothetical protein